MKLIKIHSPMPRELSNGIIDFINFNDCVPGNTPNYGAECFGREDHSRTIVINHISLV